MENNFKLEIISPEKVILSENVDMVTIPSYEGDMSILKDHISIITFLRPGLITVKINDTNSEIFFAEDGTVEFFNNTLILLSASVINIKNLSKEFLNNLIKETEEKLAQKNITDQDRYILNYKIDTIKEIRL
tara:strand:- start:375 stop:770 length:396 start_codon:yes stop_codon:yes gene_type:complete